MLPPYIFYIKKPSIPNKRDERFNFRVTTQIDRRLILDKANITLIKIILKKALHPYKRDERLSLRVTTQIDLMIHSTQYNGCTRLALSQALQGS